MEKYLDPKVDFLFKKIFGEHKDLLISFLNSLLPLKKGQEILTIEYLTPEQVPNTAFGKNSIVDVRCKDNAGRSFIVEMQSEWSNIFKKRLLVNGSKAVVKQLDKKLIDDKATKFQELKPVYVLAIVNGFFSRSTRWYHHLRITDSKSPDVVIDGLDYVLIELPNFGKDLNTRDHKKIAILWLRFLKETEGYHEVPKEFASNKYIYNAMKICAESALSPEEREAYERSKEQALWEESIKALEDEAIESRKVIAEKENTIAEKDNTIAEKDNTIAEKENTIAEKDNTIAEKDNTIAEKDIELKKKDEIIAKLLKNQNINI